MLFTFLSIILQLFLSSNYVATFGIKRPNILLVLTDDQDVALHGMFPMQKVQKLIAETGATFSNAYTSSPICCPSRASLLSGLYAHNHRTTNNSLSGGCNGKHWISNVEPNALPALLQQNGYETFFTGKYLNRYQGEHLPNGWHDFHGLHGNSRYYNFTLRENTKNNSYTDVYFTDLMRTQSLEFLTQRINATKPFFAMISTTAPHAPFTPADRHKNAYAGLKALRTPNFNRLSGTLEKHWLISAAKILPEKTLATIDTYFQQRWETLLAVDELVADVIAELERQKILEQTFVIYTSDNGYHLGQFAQPFDKRQPYETDIRVPLLIRGPGITSKMSISAPVLLLDLFPTILEWAHITPNSNTYDGQSMLHLLNNAHVNDALIDVKHHRSLLIQHWGEGDDHSYNAACPYQKSDHLAECTIEADCHCQDSWNNTYACVRHFRYNVDRLYCEFKDHENFVEAYDINDDPYQLNNLGYELLPIERAFYSLALANLTRCAGANCSDINI